ncbi:MAG: CHAP domain-containing protein [Lactobacillales bacterium]|nr:CHAP domain-containing protein [Lactobacillales bacterium]
MKITANTLLNDLQTSLGTSYDADNYYGAQCMDLIVWFMWKYFKWRPKGDAIDLLRQDLPAGFQRIRNTPDFLPLAGDIFIFGLCEYGRYGHTGFVESATLEHFVGLEQNGLNPSLTKGSPLARVSHPNYYGFWGVIRPPYASETKEEWLHLPKEATSWRVYPMDKAPLTENTCGTLKPSIFDGLNYKIEHWSVPQTVAVIDTRDYGRVQIYVAEETGAKIFQK